MLFTRDSVAGFARTFSFKLAFLFITETQAQGPELCQQNGSIEASVQ